MFDRCAGCLHKFSANDTICDSGIFNQNGPRIDLCESCFNDEERIEDEAGTNFQPDLLQKYYTNLRWGNRPKLYDVLNDKYV